MAAEALFIAQKAEQECKRTVMAAEALFIAEKAEQECSVKRAMIFAGFTPEETGNVALQRRVRRRRKEMVPIVVGMPLEKQGSSNDLSGLTNSTTVSTRNNNKNSMIHQESSSRSSTE